MSTKEALDILQLDDSASEEMIKKAYKKLARNYHPDNKTTQNEEMFLKVKQAYEFLKNGTFTESPESADTGKTGQEPCFQCRGTGKRKIKKKTQRGIVVVTIPCENCKGTGYGG